MKKGKDFESQQLDDAIHGLFQEGVDSIKMNPSFKQQLLDLPQKEKPLSPLGTFLEKEICIPVISIPALALSLLILIAVSFNSFLLPGDLPETKYEIIEIHHDNMSFYISDRY